MALYLRKVIHPQARDNYRVILKREADEVKIRSPSTTVGAGELIP